MKRVKFLVVPVIFLGLAGLSSCQQQVPDTRAADEQAIRAAEAGWSRAAQAKDVEGFVSFYTEDGSLFMPNSPIVTGKQTLRGAAAQLFASPGLNLSWQVERVEVARSGDMAYSRGTYDFTAQDAKGKPVTDRGKYVVVWKKQADGAWKAVADIFNSDLLAPASAKP